MIKLINCQDPHTWRGKIFLTFDLDWCHDEVLRYLLDSLEQRNLSATFFVTHQTDLLERMRNNSQFELGIHPNFNYLLNGDFRYGKTFQEVISYYLQIVPEACSVRSHSITQNSQIVNHFRSVGLTHCCNDFIPTNASILLKPWNLLNGAISKVPYFWEDDIFFANQDKDWDISNIYRSKGLNVFDFHPIHIFLNTIDCKHYEKCRPYLQDPEQLKFGKSLQPGVETFFQNLLEFMS